MLTGHKETLTRRKKRPNTEIFSGPYFPVFGLNLLRKSLYSVQILENADQK